MTWWYFISKYVDFFDSFFFLARKKFSHLSTLHVVHHCIMPFTSWFGIRLLWRFLDLLLLFELRSLPGSGFMFTLRWYFARATVTQLAIKLSGVLLCANICRFANLRLYLFSGLLVADTPHSAASSTWGSTSSCTSTTSCPPWGPASRNTSGGRGEEEHFLLLHSSTLWPPSIKCSYIRTI